MLKIVELGPLIHIPLYYKTRDSPSFSLRDSRVSNMQARMKITPPHLAFLQRVIFTRAHVLLALLSLREN